MRALISSGFSEGHALPALALAKAIDKRGHEVHVGLSQRWREPIEACGMGFFEVEEYVVFPAVTPPSPRPTVVDAARRLLASMQELRPDVVISDFASPAPALAAEMAGVRNATLIATLYPVQGAGLPPFALGLQTPRTAAGAALWRRLEPGLRGLRPSTRWLARVPGLLDGVREELGLAPVAGDPAFTTYGPISDGLAMVCSFPQLEYPRRWPESVHVTGPMHFDLDHRDGPVPPPGDEPLVLVATSTVQDPAFELVRTAIEALGGEPVRVLATLNRRGEHWSLPLPANVTVVDWLDYAKVMPQASLVITNGGHGTVTRALSEGTPVLVCPAEADTAENGARVTWAGVGLSLPRRLRSANAVRRSVRYLLARPEFANRAAELAAWGRANDGAIRGAELVERYVLDSPLVSSGEPR